VARTAWHILFAALLEERAPPGFELRTEVPLSLEPQRADLLVLRRQPERADDARARVLRQLWPLVDHDALIEFKSTSRPLVRGDLARLCGYGGQYHAREGGRLVRWKHLALVLVVPNLTPTLGEELEVSESRLEPLSPGYHRIAPSMFPTYVVVLDDVADAERDELLGAFGHRRLQSLEARHWWEAHTVNVMQNPALSELEGYDDVLKKLLESIPLELRLSGLKPEERLAGLPAETRVLAMPDEALRALSSAYIATLPSEVQQAIRKRIG
jgi:hypothetical protein